MLDYCTLRVNLDVYSNCLVTMEKMSQPKLKKKNKKEKVTSVSIASNFDCAEEFLQVNNIYLCRLPEFYMSAFSPMSITCVNVCLCLSY